MVGHGNKPCQQAHKDTDKVKPRINQLQLKDSPTALILQFIDKIKHSARFSLFSRRTTTIKTLLWFSNKQEFKLSSHHIQTKNSVHHEIGTQRVVVSITNGGGSNRTYHRNVLMKDIIYFETEQ